MIATRQTYGGSYRLMRDMLPRLGIGVRYVEADLAGIEELVTPRTKAVCMWRSPTNPTLRLVDIAESGGLRQKARTGHDHRQHVREPGAAEADWQWDSIWSSTAPRNIWPGTPT